MEQKEKKIDIKQISSSIFDLEITIRNKEEKNIYPMLNFYIKECELNNLEFTAKIKNNNRFLIFRKKISHIEVLNYTELAFKKFIEYNREFIINKI